MFSRVQCERWNFSNNSWFLSNPWQTKWRTKCEKQTCGRAMPMLFDPTNPPTENWMLVPPYNFIQSVRFIALEKNTNSPKTQWKKNHHVFNINIQSKLKTYVHMNINPSSLLLSLWNIEFHVWDLNLHLILVIQTLCSNSFSQLGLWYIMIITWKNWKYTCYILSKAHQLENMENANEFSLLFFNDNMKKKSHINHWLNFLN
jgi:hypothetical protein